MADEFSLIEKYFTWKTAPKSVELGVGDDAAILSPPNNKHLIISVDTLVAGVHFPAETEAHAIAHKALAVNLSDLAAMGADPAWFTLSLTLPSANEKWLDEFSTGLKTLADKHNIFLVGGDTCRGALSITIQVIGFADKAKAILRSGAKHGDKIYVTGTLGDAAAGLAVLQDKLHLEPQDAAECVSQLEYPQPRNNISRLMRGFASSCIDISDGTLADLQHILDASHVGAIINTRQIPLSPMLQTLEHEKAIKLALTGGDDYELLFTLNPIKEHQLKTATEKRKLPITCIGVIDETITGIKLNPKVNFSSTGFQHFS